MKHSIKKKMIIDCCLFYDEVEMLKFRMKELNDFVDYFIILESDRDFANKPKDFNFESSKIFFQEWSNKFIYLKLEKENYNVEFTLENQITLYQKILIEQIKNLNLDFEDLILFSDVDEIPPFFEYEKLEKILNFEPIGFLQKNFIMSTEYINTEMHLGTLCFTVSHLVTDDLILKKLHADKGLGYSIYYRTILGGYHFKHFYDDDKIINKHNILKEEKITQEQIDSFKNDFIFWEKDLLNFQDYDGVLPKNIQMIDRKFIRKRVKKEVLVVLNFYQNFLNTEALSKYDKILNINFTKYYSSEYECNISEKVINYNIFIPNQIFYESEIFELEFGLNEIKQKIEELFPLNHDEFVFCIFDEKLDLDNGVTFDWKNIKNEKIYNLFKQSLIKNPS